MQFKNRFKNKKNLFLIIFLVILILLGAGFFYWWEFYETPVEKWDEAEYSKPEDYEIIETDKGAFVDNKKAGLSFMVPEGWKVEKPQYGNYIRLYSPDAVRSSKSTEGIKGGCEIISEIINIKTEVNTIEKKLRYLHQNWGYPELYSLVNIGEHTALKNIAGLPEFDLYGIGVHVPVKKLFGKNRLYYLSISFNLENQENCNQEFDEFLKTVLIK